MTDAFVDALRGGSGGNVSKRRPRGGKQARRLAKHLGERAGLSRSERRELADLMERHGR